MNEPVTWATLGNWIYPVYREGQYFKIYGKKFRISKNASNAQQLKQKIINLITTGTTKVTDIPFI